MDRNQQRENWVHLMQTIANDPQGISQVWTGMKLSLGTVQFGLEYGIANENGRVSGDSVREILAEAVSHGINSLDTAITYGESEQVLGQIGVAGWQIVSKLPAMPDETKDVGGWVTGQITDSLARLKVGHLYAVLIHRPDQLLGAHGRQLFEALEGLKKQGLTQKIGVSIYSPDELDRLYDGMHFDLVQAPLSILDRRLLESGWAQRLKQSGVEVHARSVFLQGLLLMPQALRPEKFLRWQNVWSEWSRWLNENRLTPVEACIRYVNSIKEVDKLIVGVDSAKQLLEILAATKEGLSNLPHWPQSIDNDLINPARWNQI